MKFVKTSIIRSLGLCSLFFLLGFTEINPLVQALDERRNDGDSAAILSTDVVKKFIPIGTSEVEAIEIITAAGFEERYRRSEKNRFDRRPIDSDEYIFFRRRHYEMWVFSYQDYHIEIGVSDGNVEQISSAIYWYTLGFN